MRDRTAKPERHLTPDELDMFAFGDPARPRTAGAHLEACVDCRYEVHSLRSLDEVFSDLGHLVPSRGFSDRVMARVALPVPLFRQALSVTRQHWLAMAAALVVVVGAASMMALWLANQPEMSVAGLLGLMAQEAGDFMLQVTMAIGGLLWSSSLVRGAVDGVGRIGIEGAVLLLSALSLVTISAAGAMHRLLQPTPIRLRRAA